MTFEEWFEKYSKITVSDDTDPKWLEQQKSFYKEAWEAAFKAGRDALVAELIQAGMVYKDGSKLRACKYRQAGRFIKDDL